MEIRDHQDGQINKSEARSADGPDRTKYVVQCMGCNDEYDGREHDSCPTCGYNIGIGPCGFVMIN